MHAELPPFVPALLAFDLDGTLIAERHHELKGGTRQVVGQLHERGVRVAVVTGRDRARPPLIDAIGAAAVATGNGAHLRFADGMVLHELLSEADVDLLLQHDLQGAEVVLHGTEGYAVDTSCADGPQAWMTQFTCPPIQAVHRRTALKVRYRHPDAARWAAHLRATCPHLTVTGGLPPYEIDVDVSSGQANKGTALRRIVAQLGVSPDRVVAFGDCDNDIPLLREAAFAVQVGTHACLTGHAHTQLTRQEDLEGYLRALCAWLEDSVSPVLSPTQMASGSGECGGKSSDGA